ncbi:MFS transporter [Chloroflexota bacterium]
MNIIRLIRSKTRKVFYGWWVVAAASFLYFQGIGGVFYGFSTFFNPLMAEFGWSRAALSGVFAIQRLEGGIEGLIIGPLIDKFGVRMVMLVGIVISAIGFFALALFVNQNIMSLYLIFGVLVAMGFNAGYSRPADTAAAKWFIRKRGMALAIVTAGGGLGGGVLVPAIAWVISQLGWRPAAITIGIMFLILGLPMLLIIRSKPEDIGLLPDGDKMAEAIDRSRLGQPETEGVVTDDSTKEINFTVKEALKTSAFWVYSAGMMLRGLVLSSIVIHEIPYLVDMGIGYQVAASILGNMVFMSIPGRLGAGWFGDMFDKRRIMFICCLLQAVGILIFINATSVGILYLFVVVYGLGYGGIIPLTHALQADLFGSKSFATLMGIRMALIVLPTIAAPVLIGYIYDVTQSYTVGFYGLMGAILLSGLLILLIRHPKPPARLATVRNT